MEWKPLQTQVCKECQKNGTRTPADGFLVIGGESIPLCTPCFSIITTPAGRFVKAVEVKRGRKPRAPEPPKMAGSLEEATKWVESQGYVTREEFTTRYPQFVGPKGRCKVGKMDGSKLSMIDVYVHRKGVKNYVLVNSPWKGTVHGTISEKEFDDFRKGKTVPNRTKTAKRATIQEANDWVAKQPGQFVDFYEFVKKFPSLQRRDKISVARNNGSKLRQINAGTNRYIIYNSPQSDKWYWKVTDFEQLASKRLGHDWYCPGSRNRPRTELAPVYRMIKQKQIEQDNKIQQPAEMDGSPAFPMELDRFRTLFDDAKNHMVTNPKTPKVFGWMDLVKYYNFVDFNDLAKFISSVANNVNALRKYFGFSYVIRPKLDHSVTFERRGTA